MNLSISPAEMKMYEQQVDAARPNNEPLNLACRDEDVSAATGPTMNLSIWAAQMKTYQQQCVSGQEAENGC